jgi:glutamine amidotransferase
LAAENALGVQSNHHPDGWGVAFYVDGAPHLTRSPFTALGDQLFHRLSGVVSSETVIAHVRKATQGPNTVLNCHPFQYGRWVFAHNGDIPSFEQHRAALVAEVAPRLKRYILGETDSEVVFFIFLTLLSGYGPLSRRHAMDDVINALRDTVSRVRAICDTPLQPSLLTLVVSDGDTLVGSEGGKELYWSSFKTRCADRATCSSLSPECEAPTKTGFVNHLILSSEPLQGENVWHKLETGEVVGCDSRMRMVHSHVARVQLPVLHA